MNELRKRIEDYFSGPGFWPFFIMMAIFFLPLALVFAILGWM